MKISNVKAVLSENDIMSIITEFIKVEGLLIDSIKIDDFIVVKGSYKNKVKIPFEAKLGIGNIIDNNLNLKLFNIKISKVGIFTSVKNIALKKVIAEFSEYGLKVEKDVITVNLDIVSKFVPFVYFKAKKITLINGALEVEVDNLIYSQNKEVPKVKKPPVAESKRIKDQYNKSREEIIEKVPDKYKKTFEYAMLIPDIIALMWRLFKDKRVPIKVKFMVGGMLTYLASPIDILPDFIPFIGKIDDIAIAFFGLNMIINEIPEQIILDNWQGKDNIILIVKEAVKYISNIVGSQNVGKLLAIIKEISSKGKIQKKEENLKEVNIDNIKKVGKENASNEKGHNIH